MTYFLSLEALKVLPENIGLGCVALTLFKDKVVDISYLAKI